MTGRVAGKAAIITGAARGIGRSNCLVLAREGADIVAVDIAQPLPQAGYQIGDLDELNSVVAEVKALGRKAISVKCDITKEDEVEKMAAAAIKEFGKIDILVNNAGIAHLALTNETSVEQWDFVMNVNVKGVFLCSKHVAPHMMKQNYGKIINTGSIAGRLESAFQSAYGVSKACIHALTRVLAGELAPYKINVNCVSPGCVDNTGMAIGVRGIIAATRGIAVEDNYSVSCQKYHLNKAAIYPEDISNAVLFLASDESRNIDGMVIYLDGGHP
jgi:3-oxoacyl-[acyl-carrier protein] reductase